MTDTDNHHTVLDGGITTSNDSPHPHTRELWDRGSILEVAAFVLCSVMAAFVGILFIQRVRRHFHLIPLYGAVGSCIAAIQPWSGITVIIIANTYDLDCFHISYVLLALLSTTLYMLSYLALFWHFLTKSRLLNRRLDSWTWWQRCNVVTILLLPISQVMSMIFTQTFRLPSGQCKATYPDWISLFSMLLKNWNSASLALSFVVPLLRTRREWRKLRGTRRTRTRETAVASPSSGQGAAVGTAPRGKLLSSTPTPSPRPAGVPAHTSSTSLPPSPAPGVSRNEAHFWVLAQRVAVATLASFLVTLLSYAVLLSGVLGAHQHITLIIDLAVSWLCAIYALPLPARSQTLRKDVESMAR